MITSMPSPSTLRSKSVTSAATSISASAPRSSPVISQSIHTSLSFTTGHPTWPGVDALRARLSLASYGRGREGLVRPRRAPGRPAACGSRPGRSSCPTPPTASEPCAPTTCCRRRSSRRSGTCCPSSRSSSALCLVLGVLTRGAAVVSALLFVAFIIGISRAWARGLLDRVRVLRRRRGDPRRGRRLPLGDRPRRRPAGAQPVARRTPAHRGSRSTTCCSAPPTTVHRPTTDHASDHEGRSLDGAEEELHRTADEKAAAAAKREARRADRALPGRGRGAPQKAKRKEQLIRSA